MSGWLPRSALAAGLATGVTSWSDPSLEPFRPRADLARTPHPWATRVSGTRNPESKTWGLPFLPGEALLNKHLPESVPPPPYY